MNRRLILIAGCLSCISAWISGAVAVEPLKVFVLVGQSNMEGHAKTEVMDYMGEDPDTATLLSKMKNTDGSFRTIPDVWISYLTGFKGRIDRENREVFGPLTAGYGSQGNRNYDQPGEKIGPELAFGITIQETLGEPVLLIKTAWGGQSLHTDFRSPSSGPYVPTEDDIRRKRFETPEQKAELKAKTGKRYRQMIEHVQEVLDDIQRVYPDYDPKQGYELAGLVWFQGFNDLVARNVYPQVGGDQDGKWFGDYTRWMGNFIRDARKDLKAAEMPVVIGVLGVGGVDANEKTLAFRESQAAVADQPEFRGNVFAVATAPFWDERLAAIDKKRKEISQKRYLLRTKNAKHENADGSLSQAEQDRLVSEFGKQLLTAEELDLEKRAKSNAGYHYLGSAKTYSQIGRAFAKALLEQP